MGVKVVKDSRLVYDGGLICCSDRNLQGVNIAERFYERAWQGADDSIAAQ